MRLPGSSRLSVSQNVPGRGPVSEISRATLRAEPTFLEKGVSVVLLCKLTSVALAACDLSYQGMRLWRQLVAGPRAAGRSDGRGGGRGRPQLSTVPREHGKADGSTGRGWPGDPSGHMAGVRCDPCVCFRGQILVACPPEGCVLQRGPRGRPCVTSERAAAGHPAPDQGRSRQSLLSQVRAQTAKFCPAQAGCPHLETVLA